ncbi:hypothetical protein AAY473_021070 [Plecturocebus cupreus]
MFLLFETSLTNMNFGRLRQVDHLMSGFRDQSGKHGETSSLLKIQKLARHGGEHLLTLLPRLECNGAILVYCNLYLLSSRNSPASPSRVPGIIVETRFHRVGQAGLELLGSSDPPMLASQTGGITGMRPHAQPMPGFLIHRNCEIINRDKVLLCCSGWSQTPGFKRSSHLSLPTCWDYRCKPPGLAPSSAFKPGDSQAEQPHGSQVRLFGPARLLRPAPRRGGSPHKIHWSVCPFNWRVELREGGLKRGLNQGASPGDSQAEKRYESQRCCFSLRSVSPQGTSHRSRRLFNRRLEHLGVDHSTKKRL